MCFRPHPIAALLRLSRLLRADLAVRAPVGTANTATKYQPTYRTQLHADFGSITAGQGQLWLMASWFPCCDLLPVSDVLLSFRAGAN